MYVCIGERMYMANLPESTRFSLKSSLAASHSAGSVSSIFDCNLFTISSIYIYVYSST
jgi:hypothetical protein